VNNLRGPGGQFAIWTRAWLNPARARARHRQRKVHLEASSTSRRAKIFVKRNTNDPPRPDPMEMPTGSARIAMPDRGGRPRA